jgi:hypothetical protein
LGEKSFEVLRENQCALRLQRAADPGNRLREMPVYEIDDFWGFGTWRYRTLEKIREEEAAFLEVGQDFLVGLPCRGDAKSGEEIAGEAGERSLRGVEKLGISIRSGCGEQQSLNVDGTETRGPFQALQAAGDVLGRGELAAAVARQKCGDSHMQKW